MPHFIVNSSDIKENFIEISPKTNKELFHHLLNVLRIRTGETVKFLSADGVVNFCKVSEISKYSLKAKIEKTEKSERILDMPLYAGICTIKNEAMSSSLKKATEVGVKGIIPLVSDNCAVKRDLIFKKSDKIEKITKEAVQQCERADIPQVFPTVYLKDFLKNNDFDKVIVFSEREKNLTLKKYFKENPYSGEKIIVIFGPEGGFSDEEFEFFEENGIVEISLGKLIFRADTALAAGLFGVISEAGQ